MSLHAPSRAEPENRPLVVQTEEKKKKKPKKKSRETKGKPGGGR